MLPLLLRFEVQAREATQVLAAHRLVHSGPTTDALSVVVGDVGPPICLLLHVPVCMCVCMGNWCACLYMCGCG